jgi:hypothetical protein
MFYEEEIINGILCWRGTPDGHWTKKTQRELTSMLMEVRMRKPIQTQAQPYELIPYWQRPDYKYPQPATC